MSAHAFLAPSAAHRWVVCAYAPTLEAAYPEQEDSPESLEGTAAHWVVEMLLRGTPAALGDSAPNGVAVTGEMIEGAEMVRDHIAGKRGRNWQDGLMIERPVRIHRIHPTENGGTPDYAFWGDNTLHVTDYKFGHGLVEAFENWQLLDYAVGILGDFYAPDLVIEMTIIQPRGHHRDGPVRSWRIRAGDIGPYFIRLRDAALRATSPNPTASPDPEACKHCSGRHACEALQRAAYVAADQGREGAALDLSPEALGLELRVLIRAQALLKARVSGLEAQAEATIRQGARVPFWMLDSVPGRLGWTKPDAEVLALGAMVGVDIARPAEPLTPTQAKKAGFPEGLLAAYAARPAGAVKLVADDGSKARLTFSSSVA